MNVYRLRRLALVREEVVAQAVVAEHDGHFCLRAACVLASRVGYAFIMQVFWSISSSTGALLRAQPVNSEAKVGRLQP